MPAHYEEDSIQDFFLEVHKYVLKRGNKNKWTILAFLLISL